MSRGCHSTGLTEGGGRASSGVFLLALALVAGSAAAQGGAWDQGPAIESPAVRVDGPSDEERREIEREIDRSVARLLAEGVLAPPTEVAVPIGWPLRAANGLSDPGYHQVANFVDHNAAAPGFLLDYSCGARTIDTYGNHRGTDIRIWPFPWLKMENDQVEVIAAAAGTIVFKQDGFYDRNCDCASGSWNAIYVRHADASIAWYGHLKKNSLTSKPTGSAVAAGEFLGVVGSSGCSTSPHLHLELYNAAGQLQDPYAGPCNGLNAGSWWSEQPPYYDSGINKLITSPGPVSTPICPTVETTQEQSEFNYGQVIHFVAYFRDVPPGQVATLRILRPDGFELTSWTYQSESFVPVAKSSHAFAATPIGSWRFAADFAGQSHEVPFSVVTTDPKAGRNSSLVLGKATPAGLPLMWGGSCRPGIASYAVYAGFIGDWDGHVAVTCDIEGTSYALPLFYFQSNRYYLVVPQKGYFEGSYGLDSAGAERPQGVNPCGILSTSGCLGDPPQQ